MTVPPRAPRPRRPRRLTARGFGVLSAQIPVIAPTRESVVTRRGPHVLVQNHNPLPVTRREFYGRVEAAASVGTLQWEYEIAEVIKSGFGYGPPNEPAWRPRSGGRTGFAYNYVEAPNTGEGVQGNGINVDDLPAGFTIGPIAVGLVVKIEVVRTTVDSTPEYWFHAMNPVVGQCQGGGV